ncbi:MAG: hypothetical protein MJ097_00545 [Dorea sp.]|nr:hypothetical protein [Dorea sp.]
MIIDGKEVGEFVYKEKFIDQLGHIRYVCECYVCGAKVTYGCITYKKPICYECKYKREYKRSQAREWKRNKQRDEVMDRVRVAISGNRNCLHVCEENGALCHRYNMKCADAIMHWILNGNKEAL